MGITVATLTLRSSAPREPLVERRAFRLVTVGALQFPVGFREGKTTGPVEQGGQVRGLLHEGRIALHVTEGAARFHRIESFNTRQE